MSNEMPHFFDSLPGVGGGKVAQVWRRFFQKISENPDAWAAQLQALQQEQFSIASEAMATPDPRPKSDRRFSSEQWRDNPFFAMLMQAYLTNSEMMRKMVDLVELPEDDKKVLLFCVNQYIDAASPANFPATNPDVMAETVKTGGENIAAGMRRLFEDMKQGMVSNNDPDAFTVGDNLAVTPGKIIFQNEVMQLIEYAPQTAQVFSRPLLIVPPCINKYYILDLQPKNSFVAHMVAAGHRVFLVSWVNAGAQQRRLEWDDYLREGVMAAIETTAAICKQKKINALGFCVGGTLLCSAMAVLAAGGERPVQSLTLLAAMLDFSDSGEIGLFIDESHVAEQEQKYADGGLIDGKELARGFAVLRPNDLIWPYVIQSYYQGKKPPPFDLLFWNADSTNLPGKLFARYLRCTYLENQLANKTATMCGVKVDLSKINEPTFVVACEKDHISPWPTAFVGARLLSGEARFVLAEKGHIAGIINPPKDKKGGYWTAKMDAKMTPEQWQKTATQKTGSWWGEWLQFLKGHSGKLIAAPKKAGNVRYAPIEDAPGAFVCAPLPPPD